MRKCLKISFVLIFFLILSLFIKVELDDFFMNTIYTVAGIMFSIGIGLVATFSIHGVKNKSYIISIRKSLKEVRNSFILYFALSTACYMLDKYISDAQLEMGFKITEGVRIEFNASLFILLIILYSIAYYIINFLALQKLNDDIFDSVNE